MARTALESFAYRVLDAESGEQAIDIAQSDPETIDLLRADIVMPRMNGREVAERLSQKRAGLRVILMSVYTDGVMVRHGVREASLSFLQKPLTPTVLAS